MSINILLFSFVAFLAVEAMDGMGNYCDGTSLEKQVGEPRHRRPASEIQIGSNIEERVKTIIQEQLDINRDLENEDTICGDLGADNLDFQELLFAIQNEFLFEVSEKDAHNMKTVQDAIAIVLVNTENSENESAVAEFEGSCNDGEGQWKEPNGEYLARISGYGEVYCGTKYCGQYNDCKAALSWLNRDKDVSDLSGCPNGWKTFRAKDCETKNFFGTRQYLRSCDPIEDAELEQKLADFGDDGDEWGCSDADCLPENFDSGEGSYNILGSRNYAVIFLAFFGACSMIYHAAKVVNKRINLTTEFTPLKNPVQEEC